MQSQAEIFAELQPVLIKLARRMLGSETEAEDIVQEAYLRWERTATGNIRSPKAFLTTITTRLCLNHLDLARVRLEHDDAPFLLENLSSNARSPAEYAELSDALSDAFIVVLNYLAPTERVVFLLREAFEFDYEDIASVVDRSEENCRQILKRARERIATKESTAPPDRERDERIVSEFLDAAETGKLERLLQLVSDGAALARDPGDLSKPVPALIHDREILCQMLRNTLAQIRNVSDGFGVFPFGHDYAYVARCGRIAKGAILLRVKEQKIAAVRLVSCPVLLHRLEILMSVSPDGDCQPGELPQQLN